MSIRSGRGVMNSVHTYYAEGPWFNPQCRQLEKICDCCLMEGNFKLPRVNLPSIAFQIELCRTGDKLQIPYVFGIIWKSTQHRYMQEVVYVWIGHTTSRNMDKEVNNHKTGIGTACMRLLLIFKFWTFKHKDGDVLWKNLLWTAVISLIEIWLWCDDL